jgi:hypothetical protein
VIGELVTRFGSIEPGGAGLTSDQALGIYRTRRVVFYSPSATTRPLTIPRSPRHLSPPLRRSSDPLIASLLHSRFPPRPLTGVSSGIGSPPARRTRRAFQDTPAQKTLSGRQNGCMKGRERLIASLGIHPNVFYGYPCELGERHAPGLCGIARGFLAPKRSRNLCKRRPDPIGDRS